MKFRQKQIKEESRLDDIATLEETKNDKPLLATYSPTKPDESQKLINKSENCQTFLKARDEYTNYA